MNKCYSINEEEFNLDSISEVIDHIEDNLDESETAIGVKYWVADALPMLHKDMIDLDSVDRFLEALDEQFDEFIEEPDSVYSDVPKEAAQELRQLVLAWADKYVTEGRYYRVMNVRERLIEIEDLE